MDAMLYFLVNSATLLLVLGTLFFLLGLWLGSMVKGKGDARSPRGQERELANLRSRLQALQAEQDKQQRHASELERSLRQAREENAAAPPAPVARPDAVDAELESLQRRLNQLQAELDIEKGSNATLNADLSATAARAEEAEKKLAAAQRDRDTLREELREMEAQFTPAAPEPSPIAATSSSIDARADDLTQLKGVGEVIQGKLNDNGVHAFRQIAQWNDADIEHFSQIVGFGDRIQREDWIGQARRLHQEKYDEGI